MRLLCKEPPHILNPLRAPSTRRAGDDLLAIPPAVDAGIKDGDDTMVCLCPNQAAYPLLEHQNRLRQRHLIDRIAAAILDQSLAVLYHRIAVREKGELIYDDERERRARDVYPFPKTTTGEDHRTGVVVLEQVEQLGAGEPAALPVAVAVEMQVVSPPSSPGST